MTYDSFWSSHSNTNNYRSALSDVASFTGRASNDVDMGLSNLGIVYPFAMGGSSAPFNSLPHLKNSSVIHKRSVPAATSSVRHGLTGRDSGGQWRE